MMDNQHSQLIKPFSLWLAILLSLTLLLNGCATPQKIGFPDDTDKEPSQYSSQESYKVFGKTYHTMKSSKDYHARGVASWYGSRFHRSRTSSGERYNMLAMTAAHKTLPLPSYVQVTNLANGKKVIVKINDRGPFEKNRLIDLSYMAAKKLGMLGHGTTNVDIKSIDQKAYKKHTV